MARQQLRPRLTSRYFKDVRSVALALPGVEVTTKYDGSPVVRLGGCFVAGLAAHPSAEPDTLVVRYDVDDREWLLAEAPEIFYLTDYYRSYPLVLVRLARVSRDALEDLLRVSWRITKQKGHDRERDKGQGTRDRGPGTRDAREKRQRVHGKVSPGRRPSQRVGGRAPR